MSDKSKSDLGGFKDELIGEPEAPKGGGLKGRLGSIFSRKSAAAVPDPAVEEILKGSIDEAPKAKEEAPKEEDVSEEPPKEKPAASKLKPGGFKTPVRKKAAEVAPAEAADPAEDAPKEAEAKDGLAEPEVFEPAVKPPSRVALSDIHPEPEDDEVEASSDDTAVVAETSEPIEASGDADAAEIAAQSENIIDVEVDIETTDEEPAPLEDGLSGVSHLEVVAENDDIPASRQEADTAEPAEDAVEASDDMNAITEDDIAEDVSADAEPAEEEAVPEQTEQPSADDFLAALRRLNTSEPEPEPEQEPQNEPVAAHAEEAAVAEATAAPAEDPMDILSGIAAVAEEMQKAPAQEEPAEDVVEVAEEIGAAQAEAAHDAIEETEVYEEVHEDDIIETPTGKSTIVDAVETVAAEAVHHQISETQTENLVRSNQRTATISVTIDNERLEDLVADLIRRELSGPLGQQITDTIKAFVEDEVTRIVDKRAKSSRKGE